MWVILVTAQSFVYGTFTSREAAVEWAEGVLSTMYNWIPVKIHQV